MSTNQHERINISTGTPWEEKVGYCRAVRIGPHVWTSGTIAYDETGTIHGVGDAGAQARYIFRKIEKALNDAGTSMKDVVRVRVYLTSFDHMEALAEAHHEFFADVKPVNTTVVAGALAYPECLMEIEVDAYVIS